MRRSLPSKTVLRRSRTLLDKDWGVRDTCSQSDVKLEAMRRNPSVSCRIEADGKPQTEEANVNFEDLKNPELQEKLKSAMTSDEVIALALQEGYDLSDDQLKAINGGDESSWYHTCEDHYFSAL